MKKIILYLGLLILILTPSLLSAYNIKINIKNYSDDVVYVVKYYTEHQYMMDTIQMNDKGIGVYKGNDTIPSGVYKIVDKKKAKYFELIIDKDQDFSVETDTLDFIKHMKIKGSEENSLYVDYLKFIINAGDEIGKLSEERAKEENTKKQKVLEEKIEKLNEGVKHYKLDFIKNHPVSFITVMFKAQQEPEIPDFYADNDSAEAAQLGFDYFKKHYFDGFDFADSRLLRTPIYTGKIKFYWERLLLKIPDSLILEAEWMIQASKPDKETYKYLIWYFTSRSETSTIMGMDAVFVHLVDNYYLSGEAFWASDKLLKNMKKSADVLRNLTLGKVAPPLIMSDTLGKFHALHQVKAKYTIVYFWDTDCGHCKKETPALYEFYKKNIDKVAVYCVAIDTDVRRWSGYVHGKGWDWLNVYDAKGWSNYKYIYDVKATPVMYVLDEDKKIIAKKINTQTLEGFIERYEKEQLEKAEKAKKAE